MTSILFCHLTVLMVVTILFLCSCNGIPVAKANAKAVAKTTDKSNPMLAKSSATVTQQTEEVAQALSNTLIKENQKTNTEAVAKLTAKFNPFSTNIFATVKKVAKNDARPNELATGKAVATVKRQMEKAAKTAAKQKQRKAAFWRKPKKTAGRRKQKKFSIWRKRKNNAKFNPFLGKVFTTVKRRLEKAGKTAALTKLIDLQQSVQGTTRAPVKPERRDNTTVPVKSEEQKKARIPGKSRKFKLEDVGSMFFFYFHAI